MRDKKISAAVHFFTSQAPPGPLPFSMNIGVCAVVLGLMVFAAGATALAASGHVEGFALAVAPLVAVREELFTKQKELAAAFEVAGPERDLSKVKAIGDEDVSNCTTVEKAEKFRKRNDELTRLGEKFDGLMAVEKAAGNVKAIGEKRGTSEIVHPEAKQTDPRRAIQTLGQRLSAHAKSFKGGPDKVSLGLDCYPSELLAANELKGRGDYLSKTLFETGAGWAPESTRTGLVVGAATRPIQVLDLMPMEQTSQAAVVYMLETTRTHGADEKAEGAAYAESTFVLTATTSTVRKITDSIPVTDEQLEDEPQVEGYLSNRLMFGCKQKLDDQVLNGGGTGADLLGINNVGSIQTQALGGDSLPDCVYKALVKVRVTGRANPSALIIHPNDWQQVRLLTTADGIYIWGSPSEAGPSRIWGIPVAESDAQAEGTGLVGDFANFCALWERRGVRIEVGYTGDNFAEGKKTMRADLRVAMVTYRAAAFCQCTGI